MSRPPPVRSEPHPDRPLILLRFRDGSDRELRLVDARDLALDILRQIRGIKQRPSREWTTGPPLDRGGEP